MPDVVSKERRSEIMSHIRSKDTSIEVLVRKYLFSKGFRFRKDVKTLPGRPDIILPKYNTVVFVHGCFWHGHGTCRNSHVSKTRPDYWNSKINKNIERDKKNQVLLTNLGWNLIVVWECEIRNKQPEIRLEKLIDQIKKNQINQNHLD